MSFIDPGMWGSPTKKPSIPEDDESKDEEGDNQPSSVTFAPPARLPLSATAPEFHGRASDMRASSDDYDFRSSLTSIESGNSIATLTFIDTSLDSDASTHLDHLEFGLESLSMGSYDGNEQSLTPQQMLTPPRGKGTSSDGQELSPQHQLAISLLCTDLGQQSMPQRTSPNAQQMQMMRQQMQQMQQPQPQQHQHQQQQHHHQQHHHHLGHSPGHQQQLSPSHHHQHQHLQHHQHQHQHQHQQMPSSNSQQVPQPQPSQPPLSPSMQAYQAGLGRSSSSSSGGLAALGMGLGMGPHAHSQAHVGGGMSSSQHLDYLRQVPGAGMSPAMKPLGYSGMHAQPMSMSHTGGGGGGGGMQHMSQYQYNNYPTVAASPSRGYPKVVSMNGDVRVVTIGPGGVPVMMQIPPAQLVKMQQRNDSLYREEPESSDGFIYQVQFKRSHRNFALHPNAPRNISVGDFVRVEADRGEDLGVVLARVPANEFTEPIPTAGYRGRGFFSGHNERKWLFRQATVTERLQIRDKVEDEEEALRVICEQVALRCLPMTILDVEYQFDRHKLVFFFEADRRIDFRDLVSELFSLYKTRIWMQQVDTTMLTDDDPGTLLAKKVGLLPSRGTHLNLPQSYYQRHEAIMASAASCDSGGGNMSDDWVNEMNLSMTHMGGYSGGGGVIKASSLGKMPSAYAAGSSSSLPTGAVDQENVYGNIYSYGQGVTGGSQNSTRYGHTGASKAPVPGQLSSGYMSMSSPVTQTLANINDAQTFRTVPSMAQSILHSPISSLSGSAGYGAPGSGLTSPEGSNDSGSGSGSGSGSAGRIPNGHLLASPPGLGSPNSFTPSLPQFSNF